MLSSLILDYVACIIYIFILISLCYKHLYNNAENRIFLLVTIICLATSVMDLCMEYSYQTVPIGHARLILSHLFSYIYLILRQVSAVTYVILILVAGGRSDRFRKQRWCVFLTLALILTCGFILSNLFTHQIFTITAEGGYTRGPQMSVLYMIAFAYALFGVVYLFRLRRYLGAAKWISMVSMYAFMVLAAILQMTHQGILVEMITTALALLLIHLIVHWSREFAFDIGLDSWYDYREKARRLALTNRKSTILIVRFENANEVRTNYGEVRYRQYIQKMVKEMRQIISRKTRDYRMYYHSSGSFHVIFGESGIDIEKDYPKLITMWEGSERDIYTMRLGIRMCSLEFPTENNRHEEDLTAFGFIFPEYMERDELFFHGDQAFEDKAFEIYRRLPMILSRGLREKRFEMYYQPIYNMRTGMFSSAEALIRLKDPEYGMVSPKLFIPSAERRNMILPIGKYVLDSVFRFAARPDFEELGLEYIELNLSVDQLLQANLVDQIQVLQKKYGISSMRINLEITETVAGLQSKVGLRNIKALCNKNYTFSLDDYGTGYSNIQRAVELPLSLVKIDKSIIDKSETARGEAMIRSTIQMMHEMGFKVVSEGVETKEQLDLLDRLGCDYIQGFYFAMPMCEEEFVRFLNERNRPLLDRGRTVSGSAQRSLDAS